MILTIGKKTVKLTTPDAVRVGEESVQRMVQDVGRELERIYKDILAGGKYLKNDEGGYFEMTFTATGDVFIFGTLHVYQDGDVTFEIEVMKPERSAMVHFTKGDL